MDTICGVATQDAGMIARIETRTNALVQTVRTGDSPSALAATGGGVWVADRLDATLSRIDGAAGAVVATLAMPGTPEDVARWHGSTWATAGGTLVRIDRDRTGASARI